MYTYTIVWGGGGALPPTSPLPLNTCSHNIATRRPPHPPSNSNNTQQHSRTPNNTQQHTTTVHNSTRVHKNTNVPLFKKLWDLIFFCGTITLWGISRDILRGPRLFWPLKMSLKLAHKVIVPQKKIMSRNFLNSGTLIVISSLFAGPSWTFLLYFGFSLFGVWRLST